MSKSMGLQGSASSMKNALKAKSRRRREVNSAAAGAQVVAPRNDLLPRLELVSRSPTSLRFPSRNARALDEAHVAEVAASISALGFSVPVLIDDKDVVWDGVIRVEGAKRLGLESVPCILARHLTQAERRLLRLALTGSRKKGLGISARSSWSCRS